MIIPGILISVIHSDMNFCSSPAPQPIISIRLPSSSFSENDCNKITNPGHLSLHRVRTRFSKTRASATQKSTRARHTQIGLICKDFHRPRPTLLCGSECESTFLESSPFLRNEPRSLIFLCSVHSVGLALNEVIIWTLPPLHIIKDSERPDHVRPQEVTN